MELASNSANKKSLSTCVPLPSPKKNHAPPTPQKRPGVDFEPLPYFHGKLPREDTEDLLLKHKVGDYLVRDCESYKGELVLSVQRGADDVQHYRIALKGPYFQFSDHDACVRLDDLIKKYKDGKDLGSGPLKNSISKIGMNYAMVDYRNFDAWKVSEEAVITESPLGRGEFSEISRGQLESMPVAIKTFTRQAGDPSHSDATVVVAWGKVLTEAAVLSHLHHEHIVQLIGVVLPPPTDYAKRPLKMLIELVHGITLLQLARSKTQATVNYTQLLTIVAKVAHAMSYLEEKQYVHGDLAARNVLVNEESGTVKLSDFGHAHQRKQLSMFTRKQPVRWSPPEALRETEFTTEFSDVWAFGVLLYEVFSRGKHPYTESTNDEVVEEVLAGCTLKAEAAWPQCVRDLMPKLFDKKPNERPSFKNVYDVLRKALSQKPHAQKDNQHHHGRTKSEDLISFKF